VNKWLKYNAQERAAREKVKSATTEDAREHAELSAATYASLAEKWEKKAEVSKKARSEAIESEKKAQRAR
jgi:hypothetical protein